MGKADYLKIGDLNAICDASGFKHKLSSLRKRWDGVLVRSADWEPEPPQNYIRLQPEVPYTAEKRPVPDPVYVDPNDITAEDL